MLAVSGLMEDAGISDQTWTALSKFLNEHQLMDLVVTVGGYTINSMACNSFGIELDAGLTAEDGLTPSAQPRVNEELPRLVSQKL